MEQRIGPIIPPVPAGTDPAYVPGLVPPRSLEPEDDPRPDDAADDAAEEAPEEEAAAEEEPAAEADGAEDEEEDDADAGEPLFEASDRRSSIVADRRGITFRLDGEEAAFDWDEVGAVEIDTPRLGRRFTVVLYTTTRDRYEADVQAPARGRLKEWTERLDAVLDEHFDDSAA
ncbi:hypothetical protein GCM10027168_16210 [Streptomyces capparidis]